MRLRLRLLATDGDPFPVSRPRWRFSNFERLRDRPGVRPVGGHHIETPSPLASNHEADLGAIRRYRGRSGYGTVASLPQFRLRIVLKSPESVRSTLGRAIDDVIRAEAGGRGAGGRPI